MTFRQKGANLAVASLFGKLESAITGCGSHCAKTRFINKEKQHKTIKQTSRNTRHSPGERRETMTRDLSQDSQEIIKDQLTLNFESYTSNTILNQFTPSKNHSTSQDDLSLLHNSLKRATRSNTGSRRVTPRRVRRSDGQIHMDSNIVTSPVKTLKRSNMKVEEYSDDEYDDQPTITKNKNGSSTINIPLRDSPKEPLRRGTPGKTTKMPAKRHTPKSQLKSTKNDENNNNDTSALEEAIENLKSKSLTENYNKEDIEDDDDDDHYFNELNNTILSDIPNDILSPEKHIYPLENLKKLKKEIPSQQLDDNSSSSVSSTFTILQKKELYPNLEELGPKINLLEPSGPASTSIASSPRQLRRNSLSKKSTPNARVPARMKPITRQNSTSSPPLFKNPTKSLRDLSSPPRRVVPDDPTTKLMPAKKTRLSNLPNSQFDSSDEEIEVPEITVKLDPVSPSALRTTKRANDFVDRPELHKKQKVINGQLYPSLVSLVNGENESASKTVIEVVEKRAIEGKILDNKQSLYPKMSPTPSLKPMEAMKSLEVAPLDRGNNTNRFASRSIPIFEDESQEREKKTCDAFETSTPEPAVPHKQSTSSSTHGSVKSSNPQKLSTTISNLQPEDKWDKEQWITLLKVLKKIKKYFNLEKLEIKDIFKDELQTKVLTPPILRFFHVSTDDDWNELIIRLQFMKDYEKEIYTGKL